MQLVKQCLLLLVLATGALIMPHAKAACLSSDMPKQINIPSISVPTTLPVGSTIPGTDQSVHIAGHCDNGLEGGMEIVACYYGTGSEIPGMAGVYESGVEGIGVALVNDKGQRITGAGGVYCDSRSTPISYVSTDGNASFDFNLSLQLIKTSMKVVSGTLQQSQTKFGLGVYGHDGIGSPNSIAYAGNVNLNIVTCSVSPKNLTVNLGDFPISDFTGVGTLSTPAKTFNATVNCTSTVQPEIKITSANGYEPGLDGVLKLTPENGMATGVGVRMLFDDHIATFNQYVPTQGEAIENQTLDIPFQVRYIQTRDEVTPGPANTVATITLAYR